MVFSRDADERNAGLGPHLFAVEFHKGYFAPQDHALAKEVAHNDLVAQVDVPFSAVQGVGEGSRGERSDDGWSHPTGIALTKDDCNHRDED
ncbi:MAG: hypothetical protein EXR99_16755 [Gemmataceae bacterium]|nr:hypothetical protein [Gemmataceae bacterium]